MLSATHCHRVPLGLRCGTPTCDVEALTAGQQTSDGPGATADAAPAPVTACVLTPVLSPSRAGDFMTCPLLYRFRVIDKLPERPRAAAVRGTLVHAVLERLYDLPRGARTRVEAVGMVAGTWEQMLADKPDLAELFRDSAEGDDADAGSADSDLASWLEAAKALLERYFELEDPNKLEPAERELFVETTLPSGLRLRGFVDRLDVTPQGDMRVVDYKTGRAPGPSFEAKALFQMKFYALVLWRLRGRVPRRLQLIYLGSGEVLALDPDESDLRATERKVEALWTAIDRAARSGHWQPRPGPLCAWCDHQALCPAFGGTPPPLPSLPHPAAPPSAEAGIST